MSELKPGQVYFCSRCFATNEDGSMGGAIYPTLDDGCFCSNCCESYSYSNKIVMRKADVLSIRSQASWIGKRYYPAQEDSDKNEELKRMRAVLKLSFPFPRGRHAEQQKDGSWLVTQNTHGGGSVSQFITASSEQEALIKSWDTTLPFYAEDPLSQSYDSKMHKEKT